MQFAFDHQQFFEITSVKVDSSKTIVVQQLKIGCYELPSVTYVYQQVLPDNFVGAFHRPVVSYLVHFRIKQRSVAPAKEAPRDPIPETTTDATDDVTGQVKGQNFDC